MMLSQKFRCSQEMFLSQRSRLAVKLFVGASSPDPHSTTHIDSSLPCYWLRQPTRFQIVSLESLTGHNFSCLSYHLSVYSWGAPSRKIPKGLDCLRYAIDDMSRYFWLHWATRKYLEVTPLLSHICMCEVSLLGV